MVGYGKRHAAVAPRTSNDEGWIPDSREGSCGIVPSFALPVGDSSFGMCTSAQAPADERGQGFGILNFVFEKKKKKSTSTDEGRATQKQSGGRGRGLVVADCTATETCVHEKRLTHNSVAVVVARFADFSLIRRLGQGVHALHVRNNTGLHVFILPVIQYAPMVPAYKSLR